jgi:hypothetical protein
VGEACLLSSFLLFFPFPTNRTAVCTLPTSNAYLRQGAEQSCPVRKHPSPVALDTFWPRVEANQQQRIQCRGQTAYVIARCTSAAMLTAARLLPAWLPWRQLPECASCGPLRPRRCTRGRTYTMKRIVVRISGIPFDSTYEIDDDTISVGDLHHEPLQRQPRGDVQTSSSYNPPRSSEHQNIGLLIRGFGVQVPAAHPYSSGSMARSPPRAATGRKPCR